MRRRQFMAGIGVALGGGAMCLAATPVVNTERSKQSRPERGIVLGASVTTSITCQ